MIFLTADTHQDIDHIISKSTKHIKIGDTLIVLGDFGFVWNNSSEEKKILKKLAKQPFKILFIDGTKDNMQVINSYNTVKYNGAMANEIVKNKIYYIKRGEVLEIEGKKLLCFGGYESDDIDFSISDIAPTEEDFNNCTKNLLRHDYKVDYILTHAPCATIERFLNLDSVAINNTGLYLDEVYEKCEYIRWYLGWYHQDKFVSQKAQLVYTDIYTLND